MLKKPKFEDEPGPRRSSCIWGLAAKAQKEARSLKESKESQQQLSSKNGKYFDSVNAVVNYSDQSIFEEKENMSPQFGGKK